MPHLGSFPLLYSVLCCCWWDCTTLANVAGREVKKTHQLLLPKCFYMDYVYYVVKFSWCIMFENNVHFFLAGYVDTVYFIILFFPSANFFCPSTTVNGSGSADDQTGQNTNTVAVLFLYHQTEGNWKIYNLKQKCSYRLFGYCTEVILSLYFNLFIYW